MYIEQLKTKNYNYTTHLILYLLVVVGFTLLMLLNYLTTQDMNTEDVIHQMIEQFGSNVTFVMMVLPLSLFCLGLLFWVKFLHGQSLRSLTTARQKVDWSRIFFAFTLWGSVTAILTVAAYYASPENFVVNFEPGAFFSFLILAIILIPLQTSFEEFLFRGYLMQGIGIFSNSRIIPFVITSVLFGLMHIANPEVGKMGMTIMIYYIGTGFFLGLITLMDDGLELALGFHAANNLVGALLVTADWTAFQTNSVFKDISEPSAGFDVVLPVFIVFPILIFIFARKYKWTNWNQKLFGKLQPTEVTEEIL
ncbi:CPBP family intramembrane glutamic endopeptidase [Flavobacterium suncheonense]|uniref:CAAX protease n=1 Tax=Flavobacterium suncheonense GH29-5 = DSM 17707 TaxID=1121899 RepID=A0A0A2ME64_9FLAO|nr:type II CAAX endopeptidase family protein [Flavobacterium suncheonense]KGO89911.1 CAAX protease [Flavobacterium suncheonense GH29-5 = DSM 17707]